MRFGKQRFFLLLNGALLLLIAGYFFFWVLCSKTILGDVTPPLQASKISLLYVVNGREYHESYMRNGIPFAIKKVTVRYITFAPGFSRINSFLGFVAEPLGRWFIFLTASSMLLLTNNTVFSKGTIFQLHKKLPWISMDEYFQDRGTPYYTKSPGSKQQKREDKKTLDWQEGDKQE